MKKLLDIPNKQQGFIFPYLVFILTIVFMMTISGITFYKNHIEMTAMDYEQIKLETLIQMAKNKLHKEINPLPDTIKYAYPYGEVIISILSDGAEETILQYDVSTDGGAKQSFITRIQTNR